MAHAQLRSIPPGSTIGVFGSGQLGRMLAFEARRMGYRLHTLSPERNSPTGQIADREFVAAYDDRDAVLDFVNGVDVVTFEFENVPALVSEIAASRGVPVRPSGRILHAAQDRLREKAVLSQAGLPVTPYRMVEGASDLHDAVDEIGFPAVLKTSVFGYDGRGQLLLESKRQLDAARQIAEGQRCVLEAFVEFMSELSLVAARGTDGSFAAYPLVENRHENHILDITIAPAPVDSILVQRALDLAQKLFESLDLVGVLCIEYFLMPDSQESPHWSNLVNSSDDRFLINEIAPRPHNSGHWTIEGAATSQFEQQLRAVCGLKLGSTEQLCPAVMLNLLGDLWDEGEPNWPALYEYPAVNLHLYGKQEPRRGRKMGHLTVTGSSTEAALETGLAARAALRRS